MDWGIFVRRPSGPQDAERTYALIVSQIEQAFRPGPAPLDFISWADVFNRANTDSSAVSAVRTYADALTHGRPLTQADSPPGILAMADAIATAFDYCTRVVGVKESPAALAAGWCWLQWLEAGRSLA